MSKILKALLLTAASTGAAAVVLHQLDLESARVEPRDEADPFPGPDPDSMDEEDVAMLLNELASHL